MRLALLPGIGLAALVACGGGNAATPSSPGAALPADAGAGALATTAPPAELGPLPPMAPMPPPGVAGSKKVKRKDDAALATCAGAVPRAKDPDALVKKVAEGCAKAAPASKLAARGAPIRGQTNDAAGHVEHKLRVEAGKCYRVYFATDEGARDTVVVARDSAGDIAAESPGPALPADGVMCASAADELTLLVAVGAGRGTYVLSTWSD